VNRTEFVLAALASAAARPRTPVTADIGIKRDAPDLLVPFTVSIALRNPTHAIVPVDFPTADFYRIDVLRDGALVWSSATHRSPVAVARRIGVRPGLTPLVYYDVDSITEDRHAFAPGAYLVRVTMLGSALTTTVERTIAFSEPVSIARVLASKAAITTAGTTHVENGVAMLVDASGQLRLSRALGAHPEGLYVVRGTLDRSGREPVFTVDRFAPAAAEPLPSPT
jgi:hypothetical protein